jgi:hypothetical protein
VRPFTLTSPGRSASQGRSPARVARWMDWHCGLGISPDTALQRRHPVGDLGGSRTKPKTTFD